MTRQRGFAVLGSLVAVVVLVCAAIFAGLGRGAAGSEFGSTDASAGRATAASGGTGRGAPLGAGPGRAAPAAESDWTATWGGAPVGAEPGVPAGFAGRTLRNVVHTSIGGTAARVTLSNLYGTQPLFVGRASVAVEASGAAAVPATMRPLTFGHRASVTIAPGAHAVSDPAALPVPADRNLLVTLYTPEPGGTVTYHAGAQQTSYVAVGDHAQDARAGAYTVPTPYWRYVTAVDVRNRQSRGAIVAFGDSITDGLGSTLDANARWPDVLSDILRANASHGAGVGRYGVVDEGIGGNQVLKDGSFDSAGRSGLTRFADDVLDRAGVKTVIVDLGVNDLLRGRQRNADTIVAGLRTLTRQAHEHGLRVIGSTLTPFGSHKGYTAVQENVREQVNARIRAGGVYDEVVDFDRVVRDPYAPDRLSAAYDSGDGLHPSDAGYRVMAEAAAVQLLQGGGPSSTTARRL